MAIREEIGLQPIQNPLIKRANAHYRVNLKPCGLNGQNRPVTKAGLPLRRVDSLPTTLIAKFPNTLERGGNGDY